MSRAIKVTSKVYEELKEVSYSTGIPMSRLVQKAWEKEKEKLPNSKDPLNSKVTDKVIDETTNKDDKDSVNLIGILLIGVAILVFYFIYERGLI